MLENPDINDKLRYNGVDNSQFYRISHNNVVQKAQDKLKLKQRVQAFYRSSAFKIIVGLFFNSIAIILFIIQSYLSVRDVNLDVASAVFIKLVLIVYFFAEYVDYIIESSNKIKEFLRLQNLFDFFTIIFLIDDVYNDIEQGRNTMEDKMLWLLLSFKFLKVKEQIFSLYFKTHNNPNPDKVAKVIPIEKQIKMATFSTSLNICALCIITTSFILFVDEISNYTLFKPFNKQNGLYLEFHNALYFQILTMTTIGFGDILPATGVSRVITTIFIMFVIGMFSNWVGVIMNLRSKITTESIKINQQNKGIDDYVVIIGNIAKNPANLEQFLINHFDDRYAKEKINKFVRQVLIVTTDDLDHHPHAYINFEVLRTTYKIKKVKVMQLKSVLDNVGWIKKAQLIKASTLVCFNSENDHNQTAVIQERNWLFLLGIIHKTYPRIKLFIFFTTQIILKEAHLFDENERYMFQRVNCQRKLVNQVITQSLEHEGVGSMLQHLLLTNSACNHQTRNFYSNLINIPNIDLKKRFWLESSFKGLNNIVCIRNLPPFLIGETFINLAKFFYFYSCKKSEEIYSNKKQSIRAILIGVKTYMDKRVLVNPSFYRIQEGDKVIFIANNTQTMDFFNNLQQVHKQEFDNEMEYPVQHNAQAIIRDLITQYSLEKKQHKVAKEPVIINLSQTSIKKSVKDHTIIIGVQEDEVVQMVQGIRDINQNREIVFFFDKLIQKIPNELKKDNQLIYALGQYSQLSSLKKLNFKQSYKVLIRFGHLEEQQNMELFKIYRNIKQYYPKIDMVISTCDSRVLQFLDERPKQKKINTELWPLSLKGRFINEQVIFHSLNSLIYYQKSISNCLLKVIGIDRGCDPAEISSVPESPNASKNFIGKQLQQEQQKQRKKEMDQELKIQSKLFTIELTAKCVKYIKQFGDLQYYLMNAKYPLIALSILKKADQQGYQKSNNNNNDNDTHNNLDEDLEQPVIENLNLRFQREKIDIAEYKDQIMALNPSPYQEYLQEGDKVIVLGNSEANIDSQQLIKNREENTKLENIFDKLKEEEDEKKVNFLKTVYFNKLGKDKFQQQLEITKKIADIYKSLNTFNQFQQDSNTKLEQQKKIHYLEQQRKLIQRHKNSDISSPTYKNNQQMGSKFEIDEDYAQEEEEKGEQQSQNLEIDSVRIDLDNQNQQQQMQNNNNKQQLQQMNMQFDNFDNFEGFSELQQNIQADKFQFDQEQAKYQQQEQQEPNTQKQQPQQQQQNMKTQKSKDYQNLENETSSNFESQNNVKNDENIDADQEQFQNEE